MSGVDGAPTRDEHEALAARVVALELAVSDLSRRLPPPRPPVRTAVFGLPVILSPGVTGEDVRRHVDDLPLGLSAAEAVDRLEAAGLLARVEERRQ